MPDYFVNVLVSIDADGNTDEHVKPCGCDDLWLVISEALLSPFLVITVVHEKDAARLMGGAYRVD